MRYLWMITTQMFLIAVLAACQPAESTPLVSDGMEEAQTATLGLSPESIQTQTLTPVSTSEDMDMVSPVPPDTNEQKMVTLAKEHLAQMLSITVDQIALSEVKSVVWRDASLGCPKPAIDYIRVETPGYNIVLEAGGKTYNVHTDEANRVVMCNRPDLWHSGIPCSRVPSLMQNI